MTAERLNPRTQNPDIGIFFSDSGKVTMAAADLELGELVTMIKREVAGTVVWENEYTGQRGAWIFEAGETYPIPCTKILASATIKSIAYTTTAGDIWYAVTTNELGRPAE